MQHRLPAAVSHSLLALLLTLWACSSDETSGRPNDGAGDGQAGTSTGIPQGGVGGVGNQTGVAGAPRDMPCGGEEYQAREADHVEIYVLFDKSSSMGADQNVGDAADGYWGAAINELADFVNDPSSQGIHLALKFFTPDQDTFDTPDDLDGDGKAGRDDVLPERWACDPEYYASPDVSLAALNGPGTPHADAIIQALNDDEPNGETGIRPAIDGAAIWARNRSLNPDYTGRAVLVLVTDAELPEDGDCPNNSNQQMIDSAAAAFNGFPSIPLYTIFVGEDDDGEQLAPLNKIAAAGGTGEALYSGGGKLIEEMNKIRTQELQALPCTYPLPPEYPTYDDPDLVDFQLDLDSLPKVQDAASCDATLGGWFLDDPTSPSLIRTCPLTCDQLQQGGTVKIELGCPPPVVL